MKMTYEETKNFLTEQLVENISSQNIVRNRLISNSLSESEILFNAIVQTCKLSYKNNSLPNSFIKYINDLGIFKHKTGGFYIKNSLAIGKFFPANQVFKNVYCESEECHKVAYSFMMNFNLEDMELLSGRIRPYDMENGFLHSVCMFKQNGKEYVFDGAYYLVMEKDLYFKIFQFEKLHSMTRDVMLYDRVMLSSDDSVQDGILKSKTKYKPSKILSKRFSGLGFVRYLYNRESFVKASKEIELEEFKKDNDLALEQLNQKLAEIEGKDAYQF